MGDNNDMGEMVLSKLLKVFSMHVDACEACSTYYVRLAQSALQPLRGVQRSDSLHAPLRGPRARTRSHGTGTLRHH